MSGQEIVAATLWESSLARSDVDPDASFGIDDLGRSLSFGELVQRAERVAAALAERGLSEGDAVSWSLPTRLEAAVLELALSRLGVVQNPILPILRRREFAFMTRQTGARALVVPRAFRGFDFAEMAESIAGEQPGLDVIVVDADLPEAPPEALDPYRPARSDEVRWIFYTSGTTADPKGARHTDETILVHARGMAKRQEIGSSDRVALVFPFTHIGGSTWLATSLAFGATLLFVEQFDPERSVSWLGAHGVTLAGAGTAFHQAYLGAQLKSPEEAVLPDVRFFPGGAAPKPPQLHADLKRAFGGAGVVSAYGLTECPLIAACGPNDPDDKLATTEGRACPDSAEIRVVTLDGREAGASEEGEIRLRGPQLFAGYVDSSLDRAAFDEDGFFRSGDLGHLDADGFLTITGRLKDVIIRNGENISAKEIEDLLHAHADVHEAAVIGLPDPRVGERCCAVLVPVEGRRPTFESMTAHLLAHDLMRQKLPEQVELVEALPRNAAGKILKRELVERFSS